jgi:hypothetical protein
MMMSDFFFVFESIEISSQDHFLRIEKKIL